MKTRVLQDGTIVEELEQSKVLTVKTRCPDKWMLIDLETGERYTGHNTDGPLSWKRIDY